jgi:hypothetical protein
MRDSADHHDDVIEVLTELSATAPPPRRQSDRQVWMHPTVPRSPPATPSRQP